MHVFVYVQCPCMYVGIFVYMDGLFQGGTRDAFSFSKN